MGVSGNSQPVLRVHLTSVAQQPRERPRAHAHPHHLITRGRSEVTCLCHRASSRSEGLHFEQRVLDPLERERPEAPSHRHNIL